MPPRQRRVLEKGEVETASSSSHLNSLTQLVKIVEFFESLLDWDDHNQQERAGFFSHQYLTILVHLYLL